MDALRTALRNLLKILWANVSGEGSHLLSDFTSFVRLALADFAGALETQAAHTKESIRQLESQVQRGERDPLGRRREEQPKEVDPKAMFEETMDTVKEAGSKAIGVGQSVKVTAEDETSRLCTRLTEALYQVGQEASPCPRRSRHWQQVYDRAESDEEYKRALSTLFDIASKWLNRTLDTAATPEEAISLSTFIDDPTEEKHMHHALINIRTLCERLAGGKSLDRLFATLRVYALDIKQDKDLKAWFDNFIAHVRGGLETPGYARSQEAQAKRDQLERRWNELVDNNSDVAKQWKTDLEALRGELREFQQAITDDADLRRAREARTRFVRDVEKSVVTGAKVGLQFAMEQASWFWQDLFNVYTQRIFAVLKTIPIPR